MAETAASIAADLDDDSLMGGQMVKISADKLTRLGTQRTTFREAAKKLNKQRNELKAEVERLTRENDDLKQRTDSSVVARRVQELEGEIRRRDHRAVFDKLAKARGIRDDAMEDAWQLSGYRAEGDEVDEAAMGALIDGQKEKRKYLFEGPEPPPPEVGPNGEGFVIKPAPGAGQSGRLDVPASAIVAANDPRLSDPRYVMANWAAIAAASQERIARGEV